MQALFDAHGHPYWRSTGTEREKLLGLLRQRGEAASEARESLAS